MSYEVFTRKVPRLVSPGASLSPVGRLYLNRVAADLLNREAAEFVLLLWDKERLRIAVRPLTKKDSRAFRIQYGHHGGGNVACKSFLMWIGLNLPEKINVAAVWNENESMLELDIPPAVFSKEAQRQILPMPSAKKKKVANRKG